MSPSHTLPNLSCRPVSHQQFQCTSQLDNPPPLVAAVLLMSAFYLIRISVASMEGVRQKLFREPDGRSQALPQLVLSSIAFLAWGYLGGVDDGSHLLLGMSIAFGFAGAAELLPPDHRRSAGLLRIVGVSVIVASLGFLATNPELMI